MSPWVSSIGFALKSLPGRHTCARNAIDSNGHRYAVRLSGKKYASPLREQRFAGSTSNKSLLASNGHDIVRSTDARKRNFSWNRQFQLRVTSNNELIERFLPFFNSGTRELVSSCAVFLKYNNNDSVGIERLIERVSNFFQKGRNSFNLTIQWQLPFPQELFLFFFFFTILNTL